MKAPDFRLQDQFDKTHTLKDYAGKWVVLYFYPKDDTPGCTTEACSFRDEFKEIEKAGAVVLGAVIILFDPIFQGLAISLMGGTITSTFLTLLVVPLIYWRMLRKKYSNKK